MYSYLDSKQLTEKQRDVLFEGICSSSDLLGWKAEILSPNDISNGMLQRCVRCVDLYGGMSAECSYQCFICVLTVCFICVLTVHRTKYSLNALSHDTAKKLIRKVLDDGVLLSEVHAFHIN